MPRIETLLKHSRKYKTARGGILGAVRPLIWKNVSPDGGSKFNCGPATVKATAMRAKTLFGYYHVFKSELGWMTDPDTGYHSSERLAKMAALDHYTNQAHKLIDFEVYPNVQPLSLRWEWLEGVTMLGSSPLKEAYLVSRNSITNLYELTHKDSNRWDSRVKNEFPLLREAQRKAQYLHNKSVLSMFYYDPKYEVNNDCGTAG